LAKVTSEFLMASGQPNLDKHGHKSAKIEKIPLNSWASPFSRIALGQGHMGLKPWTGGLYA